LERRRGGNTFACAFEKRFEERINYIRDAAANLEDGGTFMVVKGLPGYEINHTKKKKRRGTNTIS